MTFLVATQLVDVDHRAAKLDPQIGHVADFIHHGGHVQQRLGRNAADVQAHAAQRGVALDKDHLESQVGRTEGRAVAARAAAQHEHIAARCRRCR